jgi:hypothetical protein
MHLNDVLSLTSKSATAVSAASATFHEPTNAQHSLAFLQHDPRKVGVMTAAFHAPDNLAAPTDRPDSARFTSQRFRDPAVSWLAVVDMQKAST